MQSFAVIGGVHFKPNHPKLLSKLKFDWNIIVGVCVCVCVCGGGGGGGGGGGEILVNTMPDGGLAHYVEEQQSGMIVDVVDSLAPGKVHWNLR